MKIARQKELLCRVIWAYMRTLEEYEGEEIDGSKKDIVAEIKEQFHLTDKEVQEINEYGKSKHIISYGGRDFSIICNL